MQIRIAHRPKADPDAEIVERSLDTEDYAAGLAELQAAVPEGDVVLWINVDR